MGNNEIVNSKMNNNNNQQQQSNKRIAAEDVMREQGWTVSFSCTTLCEFLLCRNNFEFKISWHN